MSDVLTCGECSRRTADVCRREGGPDHPVCNLCWVLIQQENGLANPVLTDPSDRDALEMAGTLIHYVISTRARLDDFTGWAEEVLGRLDPMKVIGHLAACHDRLAPNCETAILPPGEAPVSTVLIPHGTACTECLHPWWAHPAQHDPQQIHCNGEGCHCTRRQAGGVKPQ